MQKMLTAVDKAVFETLGLENQAGPTYLGEPVLDDGGTGSLGQDDLYLHLTVRTPRQTWLGEKKKHAKEIPTFIAMFEKSHKNVEPKF